MKIYRIVPFGLTIIIIYSFIFPQSVEQEFVLRPGTVISKPSDIGNPNKKIITGNKLIRNSYFSPISIYHIDNSRQLVGFLDGRIVLSDDSDRIFFEYMPAGSRIKAIYGGAVSDDQSRIALVSGLDPQRFLMLEERTDGFHLDFQYRMGTDFRHSVFIQFVSGDRFVVYEGKNGAQAVDVNSGESWELNIGNLMDVGDIDVDSGKIAFLGRNRNIISLTILTQIPGIPLFKLDRLPEIESMRIENDRIYLMNNNQIFIMETARQ